MPVCNIIVDSCAYFRLAQSVRPLLKIPFGKEKHCLGVIQELDDEYRKTLRSNTNSTGWAETNMPPIGKDVLP